MFCPSCGHENPDGARYCTGCGKELPGAVSRPASDPGSAQTSADTPANQTASGVAEGARKSMVPIAIAGAIAVVALVVVMSLADGNSTESSLVGFSSGGWNASESTDDGTETSSSGSGSDAELSDGGEEASEETSSSGSSNGDWSGIELLSSGEGASSIDELVDALNYATQQLFDGRFTSSATLTYAEALVDLMPSEVVDALADYRGFADRDEFVEQVADDTGELDESVTDYFDIADFELSMSVGDQLDSDYIESVNEIFQDTLGLDLEVEEAYSLPGTMTITLTEDVDTAKAGESVTQSYSLGVAAIEIDGRWYLWTE